MEKELDSEIIIIGAGPAGISAAKYLIENGIKVLLIDKADFPRMKPCASALSYRVLKEFPYVKNFVDTYIFSVSIHSSDLSYFINSKTDDLENPYLGFPKSRTDFDHKMLEMIKKMDCRVITKEEVINIEKNDYWIKAYTNKGNTYSGLAIIGADSAVSTVAKICKMGFYDPRRKAKKRKELNYGIEQEVYYDNSIIQNIEHIEPHTVQVFFHYDNFKGYCWHFPRSIGTNIGVFSQITKGHETINILKKFRRVLIERKYFPKEIAEDNLESIKYVGAVIPASKPYKNISDDRIVLIGDAGGFCSPLTGEGIYFSMMSGKIAGSILSMYVKAYRKMKNKVKDDAILKHIFSKKNLKKFNKEAKKAIGNELAMHFFARKIFMNKKNYDTALRWAKENKRITDLFINFMLGKESYKYVLIKIIIQVLKSKMKRKRKKFTLN